jgi:hypothetical protein
VNFVNRDLPAAQRLLVSGITASTLQLVRALQDGCNAANLERLMTQRRRMLAELAASPASPVLAGMLAALDAAVAESDRTVELLAA